MVDKRNATNPPLEIPEAVYFRLDLLPKLVFFSIIAPSYVDRKIYSFKFELINAIIFNYYHILEKKYDYGKVLSL